MISKIITQDADNDTTKVIVYLRLLLGLLQVCRVPGCGGIVEKEDIKVVTEGAMITVTCVCLHNHQTKWRSSPVYHQGSSHPMSEINAVIATYILTCGMHVKQVCSDHLINQKLNFKYSVGSRIFRTYACSVL